MGMDAPPLPPTPDAKVIDDVIRLAEAAEAEQYDLRPALWPTYSLGDPDQHLRPRPARAALVDFLRDLPDPTVAGLYAMTRVGELPRPDAARALRRFRDAFELAMRPMHREHGAADLAARPLADRLRRGLAALGMTTGPIPSPMVGDRNPHDERED